MAPGGTRPGAGEGRTMGWEQHDGRWYYYRKVRTGQRVSSAYTGNGLEADLADGEAAQRRAEAEVWRETRKTVRELEAQAAEAGELIEALARASLLTMGYRRHKGQWRKRRNGRGKE
jgi:hypothetical protein